MSTKHQYVSRFGGIWEARPWEEPLSGDMVGIAARDHEILRLAAEEERLRTENEMLRGDARRLRDSCLASAREIQDLRSIESKAFRVGFSAGVQSAVRRIRSVATDMELQEASDAPKG